MRENADRDLAQAEAANAKAKLLAPTRPEKDDPHIAAAMNAVTGSGAPQGSLSDRLAALEAERRHAAPAGAFAALTHARLDMASETARVPTGNGSRYLQQLCKHWSHKLDVRLEGDTGVVRFPDAVATMAAGADGWPSRWRRGTGRRWSG